MIIKRKCSRCRQLKPLSEFYPRKDRPFGYTYHCKSCGRKGCLIYHYSKKGQTQNNNYIKSGKRKEVMRRYHQTEKGKIVNNRTSKKYWHSEKGRAKIKEYQKRYYKQKKAYSAVKNEVRSGRLPKPTKFKCTYCPGKAQQYHHYLGYEPEHRLDVIPVCRKCDIKQHNKILTSF